MPCVGLVMLLGSLSVVMAPDQQDWDHGGGTQTIVIDPGHGGSDEGAKAHGLLEKDLTLDVGLRVEEKLRRKGFRTAMTRREDRWVSLSERAGLANAAGDSIFVSIHFNVSPYRSARGVETFYASNKVGVDNAWKWVGVFSGESAADPAGKELAGCLQAATSFRTDANSRGISGRNLYVVRHVRGPAVLIEGGFLSNPAEAQCLGDPHYRDLLAEGIMEGLIRQRNGKSAFGGKFQIALAGS